MEPGRTQRPRLARHLEGWPGGLALIAIALISGILVIPRPVPSGALPDPALDRTRLRRVARADRVRVHAAVTSPLPYDVRAVGEAFRQYGRREADGATQSPDDDAAQAAHAHLGQLRRRARAALHRHGAESLMTLRAVQTTLFLRALARGSGDGASPDLEELAGTFRSSAIANGWLTGEGHPIVSPDALRVIFQMRWSALLGLLRELPFSPTLDEWRLYYATLLAHPEGSQRDPAMVVEARRLRYVAALARRDPSYPADLARGILRLRVGDGLGAEAALRRHLEGPAGHRWSLRARNHLAAAVELRRAAEAMGLPLTPRPDGP